YPFADAHESERQRTLRSRQRDGAYDTALCSAVELGENQSREAERVVEGLDLFEGVLARVGVEHEPYLVRRAGFCLGDDSFAPAARSLLGSRARAGPGAGTASPRPRHRSRAARFRSPRTKPDRRFGR